MPAPPGGRRRARTGPRLWCNLAPGPALHSLRIVRSLDQAQEAPEGPNAAVQWRCRRPNDERRVNPLDHDIDVNELLKFLTGVVLVANVHCVDAILCL